MSYDFTQKYTRKTLQLFRSIPWITERVDFRMYTKCIAAYLLYGTKSSLDKVFLYHSKIQFIYRLYASAVYSMLFARNVSYNLNHVVFSIRKYTAHISFTRPSHHIITSRIIYLYHTGVIYHNILEIIILCGFYTILCDGLQNEYAIIMYKKILILMGYREREEANDFRFRVFICVRFAKM